MHWWSYHIWVSATPCGDLPQNYTLRYCYRSTHIHQACWGASSNTALAKQFSAHAQKVTIMVGQKKKRVKSDSGTAISLPTSELDTLSSPGMSSSELPSLDILSHQPNGRTNPRFLYFPMVPPMSQCNAIFLIHWKAHVLAVVYFRLLSSIRLWLSIRIDSVSIRTMFTMVKMDTAQWLLIVLLYANVDVLVSSTGE